MSQASQKGAGKTQHFLQLVHCWEVLWDPRSMSMSKRSPSVIEPLDDMWWCNKKHKFKNELDVYSMYVTIPFFLHKMLASHRQPTFRDRRWTKYSNLEEKIGRHPLPQMSKLKHVCVICHAVGFDLFCPPVSTLGRRQQLWNLGGAGDKVVQGLNNLSIYCIFSRMFPFKHERLWIFCLDDHQTRQGTVVSWLLPMVKLARDLTRQKKKGSK